jgi:hypothetical protein
VSISYCPDLRPLNLTTNMSSLCRNWTRRTAQNYSSKYIIRGDNEMAICDMQLDKHRFHPTTQSNPVVKS